MDKGKKDVDPVRFFGKHLVPIFVEYRYDGSEHEAFITAFVIQIRTLVFLATAGHCIRDLQKALADGATIEHVHLADGLGELSRFDGGIPFDLRMDEIAWFDEEGYLDYALILLRQWYVNQLRANNVEPLNEKFWSAGLSYSTYVLLGVPKGTRRVGETTFCEPALYYVDPIEADDVPEDLRLKIDGAFYGRVGADSGELKGTSGGPIFGLSQTDTGGRYGLVALQSSWYRRRRIIIGYPIQPFAEYVSLQLEKFRHAS